ncbi:hypothetical protein, conserved [Plasmodium malariae]|uniref:Reticulocyte binding protein n=1 Tax=Plasmodium malariae TaxID=5858 RepID=A0A1A8X1V7_PLAMA|nr:hypothetical protein, conserved [Plasmodium malariae]
MKQLQVINFLFCIFEYFFFLSKLCKGQVIVQNNLNRNAISNTSEHLIDTCLEVSNAITYYEDVLKDYSYNKKCLIYKEIGNSVLEAYKLNDHNCYKAIQKLLCKLKYLKVENTSDELDNTNDEDELRDNSYENTREANLIISEEEKDMDKKNEKREKNNKNEQNGKLEQNGKNEQNKDRLRVEKCNSTKTLFTSLLKRCRQKISRDPLVHCASFDKEKNVILDGALFCESSYERKSVEDYNITKSVYGENYKKIIIKTFDFKNEQMEDCLNMVNIYNNCSIVEKSIFSNKKKDTDFCTTERSEYFCRYKIEKQNDMNYIYTCSDIILPYLLSSKDENKTYDQLCNNISNYVNLLKEKKNYYLKKKRKLKVDTKKAKFMNKLYKIVENLFQLLKEEYEKYDMQINNLFNNLEKLKEENKIKKVFSNDYMVLQLNKVNDDITNLEGMINNIEYPTMSKNNVAENISIVHKTKKYIEELLKIQKDISSTSNILNEYFSSKNKDELKVMYGSKLNFDELKKLQMKHDRISKLIKSYAERNSVWASPYEESLIKDFNKDMQNFDNLTEIYTSQISLLIQKGLLSEEK